MKKSLERYAGWFLAAIAITSINSKAFADSVEPVLVFRLINSANVPNEVIRDAKRHVQRIYRESGVQIEWIDGSEASLASDERRHLTLSIILASESLAPGMGQRAIAT